MPKSRRKNKDPEQQDWERARDRYAEEAKDEMFRRDREKDLYHLADDRIEYVNSPSIADRVCGSILHSIKEEKRDFNYIGYDVEGTNRPGVFKTTPETLQLYTVADGIKRATVFQINKVVTKNRLPRNLELLLSYKYNVFLGKGVEKEIKDFCKDFGITPERKEGFLFIEILNLIRISDLLQRHLPEDAQQFAAHGEYFVSQDVPDDAYPKILSEAGIRAVVHYFLDCAIDKRTRHVHGPTADWSAPKGLSKSMLQYAADDVACVYDVLSAAAVFLNASRSDFIQASNREDGFFFFKANLVDRFNKLDSTIISASERSLKEKIRLHHGRMMEEETARAKTCAKLKYDKCKQYREKKNLTEIDFVNAFETRLDRLPSASPQLPSPPPLQPTFLLQPFLLPSLPTPLPIIAAPHPPSARRFKSGNMSTSPRNPGI